jgi:hypothetical protein
VVPVLAKPAQLARLLPSQVAFAQSLSALLSQGARTVPCGAPVTGVQMPGLPDTSHASHCPSQARSQQTPSMQWPLAQSVPDAHFVALPLRQPPGFALVAAPHAAPALQAGTVQQTPSVQCPAAHWSSPVHATPTARTGVHVPDAQ